MKNYNSDQIPFLVPNGTGGRKRPFEPPSGVGYSNMLRNSSEVVSETGRLRAIAGQMAKKVRLSLELGVPISHHNWNATFDALERLEIDARA